MAAGFHAVVPPLLREFRPQVLVSQHGCDSHRDDPLTNLELTIDAPRTPPSTGSPTRSQAAAGCSAGAAATSTCTSVSGWTCPTCGVH
jgi:hypothetical protein